LFVLTDIAQIQFLIDSHSSNHSSEIINSTTSYTMNLSCACSALAESKDGMQKVFCRFADTLTRGRSKISLLSFLEPLKIHEWFDCHVRRWRLRRFAILALGGLIGIPVGVSAQEATALLVTDTDLPDAPGRETSSQVSGSAQQAHPQQASASISGTVLDSSGALVPGARVTLATKDGAQERVLVSDSSGTFTFGDLPPGTYRVTVTSAGLDVFVSADVVLGAGERREIMQILLPIATARTDVEVVVTLKELAAEQVKAEEKQRVLGILPNFYSSYDPHPAPLSAKQKFVLALRSTTDPVSFLTAGFAAGIEQANNSYAGYGQGAQGYGKRYGAAYADDIIDRMMGSAILPSLLHQDPRYFYKGTGSTRSRIIYALKSAVICKGDNGNRQPNYSHVIGNFAAGGISNLYYPSANRGAWLTIRNGLIDTAGNAGANVIREFLLKRLTPKVPDYEHGQKP
jgi:hypothetical protein